METTIAAMVISGGWARAPALDIQGHVERNACGETALEEKRVYLMANARAVPDLVDLQYCYDETEQINVEHVAGKIKPMTFNASIAQTGSKTMSAPGDDDPDPEDEGCY